jgi:2,3-dihydroxybenzoate-AMP ligase
MQDGFVAWPDHLARRYRAAGYWTGETLAELVRRPAGSTPDHIALVTATERVGYAALDVRIDRRAAGLRALGIAAGDHVVVQLPNTIEFVVVSVALFRIGAVPVFALPAHRRREIAFLCAHTDAVALIVPEAHRRFDHRELAREVCQTSPALAHVLVDGDAQEFTPLSQVDGEPVPLPLPDPAGVALLLLSGGTTGTPKLIPRTHDDYAYQMRATAEEMSFGADGVYLAALPAAHNAALGCPGVLGALRAGGTAVLADSPSPEEVFPLISSERVTLTTLMPVFLPLWTETAPLFGVELSGVVIEVGGARLEPEVAARVEPAIGARLTRWFGTAEGLLSFTRPGDPLEDRVGTEGRPLSPGDEVRVVDDQGADVPPGEVGEMIVQGPYTIRGYYRAPEYNATAFTPEGFYRTGDLVRFTPGGTLVVAGRIKDVVNRGGEKVPTGEVEDELKTHPAVRDAAVLALPDRNLGEKTCAVLVAEAGQVPGRDELREFLISRGLAEYKVPDRVEAVDLLPRTPIGKVDKKALRAALTSSPEVRR